MSEIITTDKLFKAEVDFEGPVTQSSSITDSNGVIQAASASFVVGAEAANVINVAVQLLDGAGAAITHKAFVSAYLSSDAAGDVLEATAPDAIAIGTDGTLFLGGGDSLHQFDVKTEATGVADIDITEATGADTIYLNVVINGQVFTSDAIVFAA